MRGAEARHRLRDERRPGGGERRQPQRCPRAGRAPRRARPRRRSPGRGCVSAWRGQRGTGGGRAHAAAVADERAARRSRPRAARSPARPPTGCRRATARRRRTSRARAPPGAPGGGSGSASAELIVSVSNFTGADTRNRACCRRTQLRPTPAQNTGEAHVRERDRLLRRHPERPGRADARPRPRRTPASSRPSCTSATRTLAEPAREQLEEHEAQSAARARRPLARRCRHRPAGRAQPLDARGPAARRRRGGRQPDRVRLGVPHRSGPRRRAAQRPDAARGRHDRRSRSRPRPTASSTHPPIRSIGVLAARDDEAAAATAEALGESLGAGVGTALRPDLLIVGSRPEAMPGRVLDQRPVPVRDRHRHGAGDRAGSRGRARRCASSPSPEPPPPAPSGPLAPAAYRGGRVRTLIISDLHLGNRLGHDVLTRPAPLAALLEAAVDGVDRLVLLGDTMELMHGRPETSMRRGEPVLRRDRRGDCEPQARGDPRPGQPRPAADPAVGPRRPGAAGGRHRSSRRTPLRGWRGWSTGSAARAGSRSAIPGCGSPTACTRPTATTSTTTCCPDSAYGLSRGPLGGLPDGPRDAGRLRVAPRAAVTRLPATWRTRLDDGVELAGQLDAGAPIRRRCSAGGWPR